MSCCNPAPSERAAGGTAASAPPRRRGRPYRDVKLTATGKALVPKLAVLADRNDEEFFWHLSAKEREALVATLRKLVVANKRKKVPTA